jgi:Flp pilus assembly protein TadG
LFDLTEPVTSEERGAVLILVALLLGTLMIIAALVVDLGTVRVHEVDLQNASDAGALAGTFELPTDPATARDIAAAYAFAGLGLPPQTGSPCGTATACFTSGNTQVTVTAPYNGFDAVRVRACADTPAFFGTVIGYSSYTVCATAAAVASGGGAGPGDCIICVLNPSGTTVSSTGGGQVQVMGGNLVVNSDSSSALKLTGAGRIGTDGVFGMYGGHSATAGALTPTPTFHLPVPDPLAALGVPAVGGSAQSVSISGSADLSLSPGIYDTITSSSSGQITLDPGIYVVRKQIKLAKSPSAGKVSLQAHGVTIYFACASYPTPCATGESGGTLSMSGGAAVSWTPPTSGAYQGMSVFFDRENTASFGLTGSSASALSGTFYAKKAELNMTGPSGVSTMRARIIVGSLKKTGHSAIQVAWDGSLDPPLLGSTEVSRHLVD